MHFNCAEVQLKTCLVCKVHIYTCLIYFKDHIIFITAHVRHASCTSLTVSLELVDLKYTSYEMSVLLEDALFPFCFFQHVFGSEHRRFTHKKREEEKTELNCPMMEKKSFMNALLGRDVCLIAGSTDCMLALISPDFSSAEITVIRNDCANVF